MQLSDIDLSFHDRSFSQATNKNDSTEWAKKTCHFTFVHIYANY